ncbi:MAG TPA: nucleoside triphosphate pyrophosphohydrolase [Puia sp.]|nr:nucleoside triphosphate pyrophosphohydrolase [Puia sp.]
MNEAPDSFKRLVDIMNDLREKCPWDRKQTIDTLRSMTIEETYELADAITLHDWKGIKEETGDLLLHIIFYSKIAEEQNQFSINDVINEICEKLILRHPHIYGNVKVRDDEDVKKNWEKIKLQQGNKTILSGVPVSLPATVKAMRLQEKAKQVGFEWEKTADVWEKVKEEINELHEAIDSENHLKIEEEFGDLVFSLINYARFLQIDAENSLEKTNKKFISRFNQMEKEAAQQGKNLSDMSLEEMNNIWNSIKKQKLPD